MSKHFEKQIVKPGTLVVNLSIRRHRDLNLYFRKIFQKILKEAKKIQKITDPSGSQQKSFKIHLLSFPLIFHQLVVGR